jgi:hypothetical protein
MAGEVAGFSRKNAEIILETVRYLRANGLIVPQSGRGRQFIPPLAPIYVRNDSGEEIPAYACLQTTGTVEDGGQNFITVDQPVDNTGDAGAYLFNGQEPIEIGGFGIAYDGPLTRMLTDGATLSSGDKCQPVAGQWHITAGGDLITIVGDDDIEPDTVRGVIGSNKPTFRFIRFELNEELVGTTASADISDKDGVGIATAATIEDPETIFTGLTATTRGIGIQEGSRYFIVNSNCPAEEEE